MATLEVITYTDDITGQVIAPDKVRTHRFTLDGVEYEIDMSYQTERKFYKLFNPLIQSARVKKAAPRTQKKIDHAAIRAWLKEHGYIVNPRGRVPAYLIEVYDDAKRSSR